MRHAGLKQDFAHQDEQRDRGQLEIRYRLRGVAGQLHQPAITWAMKDNIDIYVRADTAVQLSDVTIAE